MKISSLFIKRLIRIAVYLLCGFSAGKVVDYRLDAGLKIPPKSDSVRVERINESVPIIER